MTNPFDNDNQGSDGDLPRYEPTSHPEDRDGFGQQGSGNYGNHGNYGSYGATGDAAADGQAGYAGAANAYGAYGTGASPAQAYAGPVSATKAIGWGFRTALRNWQLWILGTLALLFAYFVVSFLLGFMTAGMGEDAAGLVDLVLQLVVGIVTIVVTVAVMHLTFEQIDNPQTGWGDVGKRVPWAPAIVVSIVVSIVTTIVFGIIILIFGGGAVMSLFKDLETMSDEAAFRILATIFGALLAVFVIGFFLSPLYYIMTWLAADKYSIGDSFSLGFEAGRKNYLQLLLFIFLYYLICMASIITLFLGLIVVIPAVYLATAHLARQCVGGYVPAE